MCRAVCAIVDGTILSPHWSRAMKRIGPKMEMVRAYVRSHQGCRMYQAARHVAPHGTGVGYGYQTVHRAIAAGIIVCVIDPAHAGRYILFAG